LFALAAASSGWAQPGKADRAARLRKLLFERFDKDGDHQLNTREQEAVRAKLRALGVGSRSPKSSEGAGIDLRRFDSTGDGALDEDEVKAAQSTAEGHGLHLTDSQLKRLEQAADLYDNLADVKEKGRSIQASLPEAVAVALIAVLPAVLLQSFLYRLHETRGWRRPNKQTFWGAYGLVLLVLLWAYFTYVPAVW
jgi:hypothetical protein